MSYDSTRSFAVVLLTGAYDDSPDIVLAMAVSNNRTSMNKEIELARG